MTPATKKIMLGALASEIGNAADNLYRVRRQFSRLSEADMDKEYGQSGRTCRQLLAEAERWSDEVRVALAEVQALP